MIEIRNPEISDIAALKALWAEAFSEKDEFLELFFSTAFSPDRTLCLFDDERPLSALYILDCTYNNKRLAYIYALATDKDHRGQGFAKRLLSYSDGYLKERGYSAALLVPSDRSLFDFYKKLGYNTVLNAERFSVSADKGCSAPLRPLTSDEYAELRRKYLPEKGIVQEGASIELLFGYCDLFEGEDLLLAAYKDGSRLYGVELLGDRSSAAAVTAALGCETGIFRTAGGLEPFALLKALDNPDNPLYFGLAFD